MRRPTPEAVNEPFPKRPEMDRRCQAEGCLEAGVYRAPVSRDRLGDYYWFCLDHVRAYNQAWNYFAGMSEAEIELQRRSDTVWQRPSWPLGHFGEHAGYRHRFRLHDGFGFIGEDAEEPIERRPQTEEQKALAVLNLKEPVTFQDVRNRYRTLVKKLHPDANGGDRDAEEQLKAVNQAYAALKVSFA